jgi:lysophospholipase L1-like esterase
MRIKNHVIFFFVLYGGSFLMLAQKPAKLLPYRFDFGIGKIKKDFTAVTPTTMYSRKRGYGFFVGAEVSGVDRQGKNALTSDYITSDKPFYFTVDVPEGNYDVVVTLGDEQGESSTTVRAECRRLMLESVSTEAGKIEKRKFTVHHRTAIISTNGDSVRLKARELSYLHWDEHLTLEFNGKNPKVCAVEISLATKPVTIFLSGNSTVVDQAYEPYAAWGQMIPAFFVPGKVVIANYAESGETLKAFISEKRLDKIFSLMKKGDYLFIEFAHNDQKQGGNYLEPFTTYKETLKLFINQTRDHGGIPVLVTSMHRRNFDEQGKIVNTLGDYPEAVRQTGREENVPVIDLNAMSKVMYEAWGPGQSSKAFVYFPANTFPGQEKDLKDNTHFTPYGAYELAKCIVEGIRINQLGIAKYLLPELETFDPAHPDPFEDWYWPLSPDTRTLKPEGN